VRNIWLLFRIGIFLYLFSSGGRPSWRLILMFLGVLAVWAIQNGWFGANFGAEGMRRHFEGLFGLEGRRERVPEIRANRRRGQTEARPGSQGENNQQQQATASSSAAQGQEPTPEDAARRLMQRSEETNRNRLVGQIRTVERTVALFLASLWPGVGENVVRVQEQRRREEERRAQEAEVEAKRKDEEQKKRVESGEGSSSSSAPVIIGEVGGGSSSAAAGSSTSGADVASSDGVSRVNKGKAKASEEEVAVMEGESSVAATTAS
jgi:hypothetical protein